MTSLILAGSLLMAALPGADFYVKAHEAEARGRHADAARLYHECVSEDPQLAPYARVREAVSRGKAGDAGGAVKALKAVIDGEDGPWVRMAKAELARLYEHRKQYQEAATLLADVVDVPCLPRSLEGYQWALADDLTASDSTAEKGYAYCARLLAGATTRVARLEAAKRLAKAPGVQPRLDAAEAYVRSGEMSEAKKVLIGLAPSLLLGGGGDPAQALYLQGRLQLGGKGDSGREALEAVLQNHPDSPWARPALEYLARDLYSSGQWDAAKAAFERLASEYPGSDETGDAYWWLADRCASTGQKQEAVAAWLRLAEVCPNHPCADDALLAAGDLLRGDGSAEQALTAYQTLAARHPEGKNTARALYESGRLLEASGDTPGAVAEYGKAARLVGDFYAHRAVERLQELGKLTAENLKVSGQGSFVRPLPLGHLPDPDYADAFRGEPWFERLFFFAGHGFEEADWEALGLEPLLRGAADPAPYYHALADAGLTALAAQLADSNGWGLKNGQPTIARLRVLYPRAYWDDVEQMARETGLDPYLLLAVGRQESIFQSRVVSSAGATGVMQLMPGTAAWLAKVEPAVSQEHAADLTRPGNSLRLGAYYLMRMIDGNGANLVYALASYNAGPGNVAKWKRQLPTGDLEAFLEAIPFDETRGFVKKVLGNYAAYRSLYAEDEKLAAAR